MPGPVAKAEAIEADVTGVSDHGAECRKPGRVSRGVNSALDAQVGANRAMNKLVNCL